VKFLKFLSQIVNENEDNIKVRFRRLVNLLSQKQRMDCSLDAKGEKDFLTGKIYLFTTLSVGRGEEDFKDILNRENHKVTGIFRIDWKRYGSRALFELLRKNKDIFESGDIIAIIRGGGNIDDSFSPFNNKESLIILDRLKRDKNIIIITGIGHSRDSFHVDHVATYKGTTPTDAAYIVNKLLSNYNQTN